MTMRKVFALLIPLLLFSGCLSSGEPTTTQEPIDNREEIWDNHSYQFWNVAPMSMGNNSIITFNNSGDFYMALELSAIFHDPISWEQGWVNYSLIYENETVWTVQSNNSINTYTFGMADVVGNMTVQIRASGCDDANDTTPGDFFIAKVHFELVY